MSSIVNDIVNYNDLAVDSRPNNSSVYSLCRIDPVTKSSAFAVSDLYDSYVVNCATAVSVTLPSASLNSGKVLHFKSVNTTAALSSAASDVLAIGTSLATPSPQATIIASGGNTGKTALLVSNGTNWVIVRSNTPA